MDPEVVTVTIACTGAVHPAYVEIASTPDGSTTWTVRSGHDEVEAVAEAFVQSHPPACWDNAKALEAQLTEAGPAILAEPDRSGAVRIVAAHSLCTTMEPVDPDRMGRVTGVWALTEFKSADEVMRWWAISSGTVRRSRQGYAPTPDEALVWHRSPFDSKTAALWRTAGVNDPAEAVRFTDAGLTADMARLVTAVADLSFVRAALSHGVHGADLPAWADAGFTEATELADWWNAGFRDARSARWARRHMSAVEARALLGSS